VTVESKETGFQEGFQKGYEEGLKKAADEAQMLAQMTERLNQELTGLQDRLGERIMNLVMTASRQVVQDHSINCPKSIAELVKTAVQSITADVVYVTVSASPFTLKQLENHINASTVLCTQVRQSVAVNFREDERLADGGFMIFHTAGQMDFSLETRWKNVFSALSERPQDGVYQPDGQAG
ncbi:MAG: FliH/SctL family protein, partial [Limnobacter sp.]|nr:FliH/SctL family protein [Limnobacter sp.]